jgi:hypothetical protein
MTASRREKLDAFCVTPSGPVSRVDDLTARLDGLCVTLPTVLQPRWDRGFEDGSWVVAGGDGFAGEAVVQRPAVTDLHLGVARVERRSLGCASGSGVGVEAAGGEGGGDLAASCRPAAAQPGRDASDFPLLVAAFPGNAEAAGEFGA